MSPSHLIWSSLGCTGLCRSGAAIGTALLQLADELGKAGSDVVLLDSPAVDVGQARGERQQAILELPGRATGAGMKTSDIARARDYEAPNTYMSLKATERTHLVEFITGVQPPTWRLAAKYRQAAATYARVAAPVRRDEWLTYGDIKNVVRGDTKASRAVGQAAARLNDFPERTGCSSNPAASALTSAPTTVRDPTSAGVGSRRKVSAHTMASTLIRPARSAGTCSRSATRPRLCPSRAGRTAELRWRPAATSRRRAPELSAHALESWEGRRRVVQDSARRKAAAAGGIGTALRRPASSASSGRSALSRQADGPDVCCDTVATEGRTPTGTSPALHVVPSTCAAGCPPASTWRKSVPERAASCKSSTGSTRAVT